MLNEIYIDNFRCLVNCTIKPSQFQLWMGDNGSGKSSVLDALHKIQQIIRGVHVDDVFSADSLTTWDQRREQTIGLSLNINDEKYDYKIIIEYSTNTSDMKIKNEELKWKDQTFFLFDGHEAHLYRINYHTKEVEEGTKFSADWRRSVMPTIAEREDNKPLFCFAQKLKTGY